MYRDGIDRIDGGHQTGTLQGTRTGGTIMAAIQWTDVEQRLDWEASKEEYDRIRTVWLKHCDTELKQDMEGLLSTLTDDCVYRALLTTAAGPH
jgi:hypothetical protein